MMQGTNLSCLPIWQAVQTTTCLVHTSISQPGSGTGQICLCQSHGFWLWRTHSFSSQSCLQSAIQVLHPMGQSRQQIPLWPSPRNHHFQEMILSKETYETYTACFDIQVKHVHSDNGVFTSADFAKHLDIRGQCHSLCGVSAHWQNGMVECYIGVITSHAQTMLLHVMST